jgi:hypothetical protein
LVRCGHCNAVFNAYDTLLPELEEPPVDAPLTSDDGVADPIAPEVVALATSSSDAAERNPDQQRADAEVDSEAALPEQVEEAAPQEANQDILLQALWAEPAAQPARRQWSWKSVFNVFLLFMLVSLFLLQATYFLRAELAATAPITRPTLELLCRPLNCVVPLPRQLTQAAIAASSLEHDPEQKSRVRLTFLLANRTGQTQAWPQITLTLSDVREAPVGQQAFRPEAYLPKGVKVSAGMAAGAEREIRLDLDIGNLVASGYALSLAYP